MSGEQIKPGYKRTEVGVIPEDWVCAPLSDFLSFISYGFTNPMPTVLDGVYMITAADIFDGRLQLDAARKTSAHAYKSLLTAKSKPRQNDILLTKDGTLGRLGLVGDEVICVNQSVAVLRSNEKALPIFLKLLLESPYYQKRMVDEAGGSTIKHIYITIVDQMPIGLPAEKTEQQAIATALSDVDTLLAKLDQLIAKKRDLKQATMQQLLTGQTRLPGFSGAWEVKRLGELADVSKGAQLHSEENRIGGDFPHYNGGISPSGFTHKTNAPANSIAISEGGNSCGFVQLIDQPFWCGGHCYLVDPKGIDKQFLYQALKGRQKSIMELRVGSGLPNVQKTALLAFPFESPIQREEQMAIATVLSDMDAELATLESRREKTQALKQGMMQELLTGRIRLV